MSTDDNLNLEPVPQSQRAKSMMIHSRRGRNKTKHSKNKSVTPRMNKKSARQKHRMKRSHSANPFDHKPFKPGPRDIGRTKNSNWTPIEYDEKSIDKPKKKSMKKHKVYKPGPREIGRIKNNQWKPIKLTKEEQMKLNSGNFLEERIVKSKNTMKNANKIYKPGPRDIGRNHDWNPIPIPIKSKRIRIKRNNNNKSKLIIIPNLKIVYSPSENEAIFIGYKNIDKTEMNLLNVIVNDDNSTICLPKPQPAKFTFDPNQIEWKLDDENDDENELSDDENIDENDDNGKKIKISELLSDLLDCEFEENGAKRNSYTIVIDEIKQNDDGQDVFLGCLTSDKECDNQNGDEDNEELLFDFQSFVNSLKKNK